MWEIPCQLTKTVTDLLKQLYIVIIKQYKPTEYFLERSFEEIQVIQELEKYSAQKDYFNTVAVPRKHDSEVRACGKP